ncbi:hypothetical protein [Maridesulfovibrio sp.]|uniref:hypothetical protein n=1 Tax=Maridesulfovibrio sp. TaxID=2795000 RepID=UPI0029CA4041|nr:hypothetical protein [Maridesulfovibrio sp.]
MRNSFLRLLALLFSGALVPMLYMPGSVFFEKSDNAEISKTAINLKTEPAKLINPFRTENLLGSDSQFDSGYKMNLQDNYIELFKRYMDSLWGNMKHDSAENIIDNNLTSEIVSSVFYYPNFDDVKFIIPIGCCFPLFDSKLNVHEYTNSIKPEYTSPDYDSYLYVEDKISCYYNEKKWELKEILRMCLRHPSAVELFYAKKKSFIINAIEQKVTVRNRISVCELIDCIVESFRLILDDSYRRTFRAYLDRESTFLELIDRKRVFRNSHLRRQDMREYPLMVPEEYKINKDIIEVYTSLNSLRVELFDKTKSFRATSFAYRRYLDGGTALVEKYIEIITDVRDSLFANPPEAQLTSQ